jgi:hypothetical protein
VQAVPARQTVVERFCSSSDHLLSLCTVVWQAS